jgi:hypothetical protein
MPNLPYHSSSAEAASSPFGGVTLTINAIAYRAMNWAPKRNSRKIRRNDGNGDQVEFQIRPEPTTQSGLTLQLALASTAVPSMGQEFTVDSLVYVITNVDPKKPEGEFWTVDIDYESKVLPTD